MPANIREIKWSNKLNDWLSNQILKTLSCLHSQLTHPPNQLFHQTNHQINHWLLINVFNYSLTQMFNQSVNQSIIQTVTQTVNQSLCYCWSQTPFEMAWKLAHFLCCWLLLVVKKWSYGDILLMVKLVMLN